MMDAEEVRRVILEEIDEEDLKGSWIAEMVGAIRALVVKGEEVSYPRVAARVGDDAREMMTRIAALPHPPATLEEGRGCLMALRAARFERLMGDIQKRLESGGEAAEVDDLLRRKVDLKRKMEALRAAPQLS
jgi:hypothetical protein